jgi:hypothetical protein
MRAHTLSEKESARRLALIRKAARKIKMLARDTAHDDAPAWQAIESLNIFTRGHAPDCDDQPEQE